MLLTDADAEAAPEIGEKIRLLVLDQRARQLSRPDRTPTVSVAAIGPRPNLQPRDLIRAADAALYEAKSKGRNRTEPAPMPRLVSSDRALVAA